jgi:hypothetical protein
VKGLGSVAIGLVLAGGILFGLWQMDGGQTASANRVVYVVIAALVFVAVVIGLGDDILTRLLSRLGRSSGDERGPQPGAGAVIHRSSGEADFDGLSGDVLPPPKNAESDQPYPPRRAAD